jgi:hypothetical protein
MAKDNEAKAEDLMEGLDSKPAKAKPKASSSGAVSLDVYLADNPLDKYAEALIRQSHATEQHTVGEWADVVKTEMSRTITSD